MRPWFFSVSAFHFTIMLLCICVFADRSHADEPHKEIQALMWKAELVAHYNRGFRGDKKLNASPLSDQDLKTLVTYLRGKYPFVSLENRLAYEVGPKRKSTLTPATKERLSKVDDPKGMESRVAIARGLRAFSLKSLHSENVNQFITKEGEGISRFSPSIQLIPLAEVTPARLDSPPAQLLNPGKSVFLPKQEEPSYYDLLYDSDDQRSAISDAEHARTSYAQWMKQHNPRMLPTRTRLVEAHADFSVSFAGSWRNGYAKDVQHVAGFAPHAVTNLDASRWYMQEPRHIPQQYDEKEVTDETGRTYTRNIPRERTDQPLWRVKRMHLVSLLKQQEPRVYLSENRPKMDELNNTKTRSIDDFETSALNQLYDGEDIVIGASEHQTLMLGSLRAQKACLSCHNVDHGELLGAFTYELVRSSSEQLPAIVPQRTRD